MSAMSETAQAFSHPTTPTRIALGDGLVLRSVQSEEDADRYAAFNGEVNNASEGLTCAALLAHHPTLRWDDFWLVEDKTTGALVSCTCLIPWKCRMGEVELRVAMLEMVVTHPDYRHRGLVRRQIAHFHDTAAAQEFDLCIIQGIPYYYRQYGYAYALDHACADDLPLVRVPDGEGATALHVRAATLADIELLDALYEVSMSMLALWTARTLDYWRYLIEGARTPIYMIEDATSGASHGYVMAWRTSTGARVEEHSFATATSALAFLQWCKAHIDGELLLGWPVDSPLVALARTLGSRQRFGDQWLLRAVNLPRLVQKLAPVWAARLADSPYAGLTDSVTINLYRQAYALRFEAGALVAVESLGFVDASMGADGGDLCIPPDAFMRLLLGYRTLDELTDAWPDIVVRPARRHLLDTLWPTQNGYIAMPYMAYGAGTKLLTDKEIAQ